MFETFRNAFKIQDLRKKLLYTLMIIVVFRLGANIPVPFLDAEVLKGAFSQGGNLLGYLDLMTGGALQNATLFAMSITPYINASIIIQLLTVAIPALERMQKEGEDGRKKLIKITRYLTVILALIQAAGYYFLLRNKLNAVPVSYMTGFASWFVAIVIIAAFTAGASLIMWLGEQVNEKGIGNGISIILFAGIVSRGPSALLTLINSFLLGGKNYFLTPLVLVIFIAIIVFIVVMTNAERRIPVQYAKRVVGRKMYGGQSSHIPIKVSMSGVMPIIFAGSILSIPGLILQFAQVDQTKTLGKILGVFNYNSWFYGLLYFLLIIAFNYFYVAIQYNPIEIANNLRKNNGAIPGIRPGKPTSDFIMRVISRITLVGALFLGVIAVCPILFSKGSGIDISLGGTSIIIIVGVALETMRTLESQMMMRHHKGFLE